MSDFENTPSGKEQHFLHIVVPLVIQEDLKTQF